MLRLNHLRFLSKAPLILNMYFLHSSNTPSSNNSSSNKCSKSNYLNRLMKICVIAPHRLLQFSTLKAKDKTNQQVRNSVRLRNKPLKKIQRVKVNRWNQCRKQQATVLQNKRKKTSLHQWKSQLRSNQSRRTARVKHQTFTLSLKGTIERDLRKRNLWIDKRQLKQQNHLWKYRKTSWLQKKRWSNNASTWILTDGTAWAGRSTRNHVALHLS